MRLRTKLLVPFLALPLASIAILGLLAYRGGRQAIEDSLGQLYEAEAARGIDALDREALALYREAEEWAGLEPMQDVLTRDMDGRISSLLVGRARALPALRRAVVGDVNGQVVAASSGDSLGSVVSPPAKRGASQREACRDETGPGSEPTMSCAFRIPAQFDEARVLGSLVVTWDLVQAFERLGREQPLVTGRAGWALLRRDGLVVAASPGIQPMAPRGSRVFSGPEAAVFASEGRRGFRVITIEGEPHLVGYARSVGLSGWSLVVIEKATVAFAPAYRLRDAVLAVALGMGLLAFLLSILGSARLTRPLRELDAAARRVADGDLTVRLEPRFGDEIDSLSRSFGQMIGNLAHQRAQLVDKEYVDSLIAGMSDGLFVVDGAGRVARANPALVRALGRPLDSVLGWPAGELFAEGDEAFAARVLEPARWLGTATEVELGLRADGTDVVPVIVSAGRLPATGRAEPSEVVCITTDITRRKAAEAHLLHAREAAEDAAVAKARFLAAVSHEVRTPLNGIIGMTDLLAGTALSDKQREYVDTARRSSEALLSMLSDILDYSRMDAGKLQLARVAFDLRQCIDDAADILAPAAREKGLELSVYVDDRIARRVVGDPHRLRQVLLNLGSNAVKFTPAGGVVIRAELAAEAAAIAFSVADTGIGVPESDRERIFEPFQQVDTSTTRRHGGVGLGLAIARQIVATMGGAIEVESNAGRGSTFAFAIELPPVVEDHPEAVVSLAPLDGLRVLVVDDNRTNRLVVGEMLRSWRCLPEEAGDAWEALDMLRSAAGTPRQFQLALVDFQMPEMDGAALAREIKADARLAQTPLVLLTSIPQHAEGERSVGQSFAACLIKPIRQARLLETIAGVLERSARRPPRHLSIIRGHAPGDQTGS
jgi:two-component system, sensor histidine kinase and response regulator